MQQDFDRRRGPQSEGGPVITEKVVHTRRIAKVVKGGRHLRFNALVVIGDGEGMVGVGMGKAAAIPDAVRKANASARRASVQVPIKISTIPHEITAVFGASWVLLKPAPAGTGLIASSPIRAVLDAAGIKDAVAKTLRSRNPINVVYATMKALSELRDPAVERAKRRAYATKITDSNGSKD
tara:strand:- start:78 stop:620 length:543 start_codon:yes stop_codon:yes gene_type:complete